MQQRIYLSLATLIFATTCILSSAQKTNPVNGINWPQATGSGAPALTCNATYYGLPYTDTTGNNSYVCSSTGWTKINGAAGSVSAPPARQYQAQAVVTSTITAAVQAITNSSPWNRYLLYVPNGTYNECVAGGVIPDYVDIVGQSQTGVMVNCTTSSSSAIEVSGLHMMLANMTVTANTTSSGNSQQYAVHADSADNSGGAGASFPVTAPGVILYNLKLHNTGTYGSMAALGLGMYPFQQTSIINVTAISDNATAVFAHNWEGQGDGAPVAGSATAYFIVGDTFTGPTGGLHVQNEGSQTPDSVYISNSTISNMREDNGPGGAGETTIWVDPLSSVGTVTQTSGHTYYSASVPQQQQPGNYYIGMLQGKGAWIMSPVGTNGSVTSVVVTSGGTYSVAPLVEFNSYSGSGAYGTVVTSPSPCGTSCTVTGVTITSPGSNYFNAPQVEFYGGAGSGAVASAAITVNSASPYLCLSNYNRFVNAPLTCFDNNANLSLVSGALNTQGSLYFGQAKTTNITAGSTFMNITVNNTQVGSFSGNNFSTSNGSITSATDLFAGGSFHWNASAGHLGLGTNTPAQSVEIAQGYPTILLTSTESGVPTNGTRSQYANNVDGSVGLSLVNDADTASQTWAQANRNPGTYTVASVDLPNGNIGIGYNNTYVPTAKLDVNGTVSGINLTATGLLSAPCVSTSSTGQLQSGCSGGGGAATSLAGGALGSAPYQSAPSTTAFVASPTTSGHVFAYAWQPTGSAVAPAAFDLTATLAFLSSSNVFTGANNTFNTITIAPSSGSTNGTVTWGNNYGATAAKLFDNGSSSYGWMLNENEMQFYTTCSGPEHVSFNSGSSENGFPSGTGEYFRFYTCGPNQGVGFFPSTGGLAWGSGNSSTSQQTGISSPSAGVVSIDTTAKGNGAGRLVAAGYTETLYTPASSSAACTAGQFADDANYHYVCVAANTWKRVALTTF